LAGIEVARGFVGGEALEVPPGQYSILVDTASAFIERGVSLAPGARYEVVVE